MREIRMGHGEQPASCGFSFARSQGVDSEKNAVGIGMHPQGAVSLPRLHPWPQRLGVFFGTRPMTSSTRRSASPATNTPTKPVKTAPKSKAKPKPKAKPKTPRPLTDRVRVFIAEYAKDRNGTQAAIRAGYSPKTAQVQSADILSRPMVRAAVDEMMARIETKCELTAERTLREVARIAYFDPRRLFNDNGDPLPLHALDDDTAAAIQGVEVLEEWEGSGEDRRKVGEVKKYKVADKNAALDKAMKHHGLYKADNTQVVDAFSELLSELSAQGSRLPIKKGGRA